jgi:pimeloyl-ACP methyl ester carboxylesterase
MVFFRRLALALALSLGCASAAVPDKLVPNDNRVTHNFAHINGKNYHYLLANPKEPPVATILLVHGWPDISFGWRYQVPYLLSLGLRVIVPDMIGYGRTDAPWEIPEYSIKSSSDDLAVLVRQIVGEGEQILLGGHDWGGYLVWRLTLYHPDLIRAVFSVCTPYTVPRAQWLNDTAYTTYFPTFGYQLQLAGPDVEAKIVGKDKLRQFLSSVYGGKGPKGEVGFTPNEGALFDNLSKIGPSPLLTTEETNFYVDEYSRHGMHGPLNWYRTRRINYEEEQILVNANRTRVSQPSLMLTATHDLALPPVMTKGMSQYFDSLAIKEVNATHWALWEAPEEVNKHLGDFLTGVLANKS